MTDEHEAITLSVIVPVYRGARFLPGLVDRLESLRLRWASLAPDLQLREAIFVMDAPVDDSARVLQQLLPDRPWLRMVELSRNYGQHSATVAGNLYSCGDWVVTMDEDLQHDPADIENLLRAAMGKSADVVYARASGASHGDGYRDSSSGLVKAWIARISGNPFVRSFSSFRLIRGDIARAASGVCAQSTYFDVALTWFTHRITQAEVPMSDDRYIRLGESGYSFWSLMEHAKKLVLTSNLRALRFTTALSMSALLAAVVTGISVLYMKYFSSTPIPVRGWASLMIVLLGLGGATIFILGVMVEFLHSSMQQLQGKPAFFVTDRSRDPILAAALERLPGK